MPPAPLAASSDPIAAVAGGRSYPSDPSCSHLRRAGIVVFWIERRKLLIDNKRSILPSLPFLFFFVFGPRRKEEAQVELEVTEYCVDCTSRSLRSPSTVDVGLVLRSFAPVLILLLWPGQFQVGFAVDGWRILDWLCQKNASVRLADHCRSLCN